jgi:hypothetical protein
MAVCLLFDVNLGRRHNKPRVYRHSNHDFDENEYRERYRFTEGSVHTITELLEPELYRPSVRLHSLSALSQVEMTLRYYVTRDKMRTISDTMGFHKSSVSRSVRVVLEALTNVSPRFIKWPSSDEEKSA